jgi:CheY-like chemotaxis protein
MTMNGEAPLILLVEDNPDHAELVRRSLAEHRVASRVRHVTDGQAALDYLFRRGEYADPAASPRAHVVLLDLRLPRVDGIEVLRAVKEDEALRATPVVVLTTSSAEKDVEAALRHHVNSYLVKPVGFDEFDRLMRDLGTYWLEWNVGLPAERQ